MKIAIVYDLKENYSFDIDYINYYDFTYLSEVENVRKHLELAGHKTILINNLNSFLEILNNKEKIFDLVFNMYEGFKSRNREGLIPAICESYGIPYTFSDAFGSSLSLHKFQTNCFLEKLGINVPKGFLLTAMSEDNLGTLIYPVVIKPNTEGSSTGVKLIYEHNDLSNSINESIQMYGHDILIEEYIKGAELSVCILGTGDEAYIFSVCQYVDLNYNDMVIFDRDTKQKDLCFIIKPRINNDLINKLRYDSLFIHRMLKFNDISRIDWRVDQNKNVFLEATPLPDLSPDSIFEWSAISNGLDFSFVMNYIVKSAMKRIKRDL
jgi:D-alanine-D-alanine ligase